MKIIIVKNYQTLSVKAANLVIKQIKKKRNSVLGLATGDTPIGMYRKLRRDYKSKFKNVTTFNLDEYAGLSKDDKRSYYYYMQKHFLKHINIKKKNIFILDGLAKNFKKECANYEKLIAKKKKIDLQILGLGLDGHIGFNEPGSAFRSKTRVVNLTAETRQDHAKNFKSLKQAPKQAITMGVYTIMQAKKIILLASGKGKADIVARALKGKINKNVPASYLQLHSSLIVILTKQAATKL